MDYLQKALAHFNTDKHQWYGWKKFDDNGNKIPNDQRMTYANIKIIKDGATMPTEAEVNAKIQELKDAEIAKEAKREEAKNKLIELGLTTEDLKALGL
ncbi:hypothetical protein N9M14_02505 [Candidatus Pelagibacter bacterium]|nr:hypothetical protein [Candidatus Pelagibacter bacterium]